MRSVLRGFKFCLVNATPWKIFSFILLVRFTQKKFPLTRAFEKWQMSWSSIFFKKHRLTAGTWNFTKASFRRYENQLCFDASFGNVWNGNQAASSVRSFAQTQGIKGILFRHLKPYLAKAFVVSDRKIASFAIGCITIAPISLISSRMTCNHLAAKGWKKVTSVSLTSQSQRWYLRQFP